MATHSYAGHQVLFRQAIARCQAARRFAAEATLAEEAGGNSGERRQRERDAVIVVIVLIQGAAEGYINWVHHEAGTRPHGSMIDRWDALPALSEELGRPEIHAFPDDHRNFLNEVAAWRNFLLHADDRALRRLVDHLVGGDQLPTNDSVISLLTAELAGYFLRKADLLFRWAEGTSGVAAPFTEAAFVAPDE